MRAMRGPAAAFLLSLQGADAAWADGLPVLPFGPPEAAIRAEADPVAGPALRAIAAADEGSLGRVLAEQDTAMASRVPPAGRQMAEYLAATLDAAAAARGTDAALDRAERAVAIERQTAANAVMFGDFFGGGPEVAATGLTTGVRARAVAFALDAADAAVRSGDRTAADAIAARAFLWAQTLAQGPAARAAAQTGRLRSGAPAAADTAEIRELAGRIARLTFLMKVIGRGLLDPYPKARDFALTDAAAETLGVQAALAGLERRGADLAGALLPRPVPLAALRAGLGEDDAVVLIVPDDLHFSVFAVTRQGFGWRRSQAFWIDLDRQMTAMLTGISAWRPRGAMRLEPDPATTPGAGARAGNAAMMRVAWLIYRDLLKPVEGTLAGHPRLLIASTGQAARFPFQMLLTARPVADAGFADQPWLVRRHAIAILPAVELATLGRTGAAGPPRYLGFGDPDYRFGAGGWADANAGAAIRRLPPLPEAAGEVRAVAALVPPGRGAVLTGRVASEAAVEALDRVGALARADVLHFATHGLIFGDDPDIAEGAIALAASGVPPPPSPPNAAGLAAPVPDGALTEGEIGRLTLRARLVILSACNTAATASAPYDGLGSLAGAFLSAGAERVLASHWPVNSDAAVEIVTRMARADPAFADPAAALRSAALSLIAEGGERADPAYWAPFSLIGAP